MMLHIGLPQILFLLLAFIGLVISFVKHGERTEYDGFATTITLVIELLILYWGGFFSL